jgi:hypothetical protein
MIQPILVRLLDDEQFLSRFGVRSVSKIHERHKTSARFLASAPP